MGFELLYLADYPKYVETPLKRLRDITKSKSTTNELMLSGGEGFGYNKCLSRSSG
jgi:hypothetical protein